MKKNNNAKTTHEGIEIPLRIYRLPMKTHVQKWKEEKENPYEKMPVQS